MGRDTEFCPLMHSFSEISLFVEVKKMRVETEYELENFMRVDNEVFGLDSSEILSEMKEKNNEEDVPRISKLATQSAVFCESRCNMYAHRPSALTHRIGW